MYYQKIFVLLILLIVSTFEVIAGLTEHVYGNYRPIFSLEQINDASCDRNVFVPSLEMKPVVENALKRLNERIDMLDPNSMQNNGSLVALLSGAILDIRVRLNEFIYSDFNQHVLLTRLNEMKTELLSLKLPNELDNIAVSNRDILLAVSWSNGYGGWSEVSPPIGWISIPGLDTRSHSIRIQSNISNLLYEASPKYRPNQSNWPSHYYIAVLIGLVITFKLTKSFVY